MKPRRGLVLVAVATAVVVLLCGAGSVAALRPAVSRGAVVDDSAVSFVEVSTRLHAHAHEHDTLSAAVDAEAQAQAEAQAAAAATETAAAAAGVFAAVASEAQTQAQTQPSDKPQPAPASKPLAADDTTQIHGKIRLNGQNFKTDCDCKEVAADGGRMRFSSSDPCVQPPSRFRVRKESFNSRMGLSRQQLVGLLGKPRDAKYVKVDDVSFASTDARETDPVVATPGGDFGELFLALAEYETLTKRAFSAAEVKRILVAWLDWPARGARPLTLQTDEAALLHVQQNLHFNGEKGKVVALDIEAPKPEYETELLKDLPHSKNTGCYYLKAVLDAPQRFFVRKELLPHLLRSFYSVLWDKKTLSSDKSTPLYQKVRLNILQGEPAPKAWINFRASHACERAHMAPVWRPFPVTTARAGSVPSSAAPVIVNHPEAAKVVRRKLAKFFSLFNPMLSETTFTAKLNHRGNTYMEIAAEVLGSQVPFFTVNME